MVDPDTWYPKANPSFEMLVSIWMSKNIFTWRNGVGKSANYHFEFGCFRVPGIIHNICVTWCIEWGWIYLGHWSLRLTPQTLKQKDFKRSQITELPTKLLAVFGFVLFQIWPIWPPKMNIEPEVMMVWMTSWWLNQPHWKLWVKLESFPQVGVNIKKIFENTTQFSTGCSASQVPAVQLLGTKSSVSLAAEKHDSSMPWNCSRISLGPTVGCLR